MTWAIPVPPHAIPVVPFKFPATITINPACASTTRVSALAALWPRGWSWGWTSRRTSRRWCGRWWLSRFFATDLPLTSSIRPSGNNPGYR